MDFGIDGKTALVAASSKGLGRAVAEELGAEGARVILCARGTEALEATRAAMADSGAEVTAVVADLTDPRQIEHVIETGVQAFGPIDILITNTGGPPPGPFESHTPEVWDQAVRENLSSVLNMTRCVLPAMKERRWGRIITITSVAVKQPVDGLILSNSIRAAVTGFAKTLANEVASFGITVNNVMPGYTRTERLDQLAADIAERSGGSVDDAFAAWEGQIPLGRVGDPREFGALVAFLVSERASYITGTSIAVDGGAVKGLL